MAKACHYPTPENFQDCHTEAYFCTVRPLFALLHRVSPIRPLFALLHCVSPSQEGYMMSNLEI